MNVFVLKNTFIKIYIYYFLIIIFIKNKELKLGFGNRVVALNNFFMGTKRVPIYVISGSPVDN